MPGYLDRFEYDIFLSYAWARNVDLTLDKKWVRDLYDRLLNDLRGHLVAPGRRSPRIFLDTVEHPTGDVSTEFRKAVQSSAIFLAFVDAHFCQKPDLAAQPPVSGCFCLKEVDWFASQAPPVWNGPAKTDKRIFRVQTMPLDERHIPEALRQIPLLFFEGDASGLTKNFYRPPISTIDQQTNSRIHKNYNELVQTLANTLDTLRKLQDKSPILRFFVSEPRVEEQQAAEPGPYTQSLASSLRPHEVVSVPRRSEYSDVEYHTTWKTALELSGRSVHIVNGALLASEHLRFEWELQLKTAALRKGCRTTVWVDRKLDRNDRRVVDYHSTLKRLFSDGGQSVWPENLELLPLGFENLSSHLADTASRAGSGMAGDAAFLIAKLGQESPPIAPSRIFFYCREKDFDRLRETVHEMADLNLAPSFFVPSQKKKAIQLNQIKIQNSVLSVVYWGAASPLEVTEAVVLCATIRPEEEVIFGLDPFDAPRDARSREFENARAVAFPTNDPKGAARILHDLVQERLARPPRPPHGIPDGPA